MMKIEVYAFKVFDLGTAVNKYVVSMLYFVFYKCQVATPLLCPGCRGWFNEQESAKTHILIPVDGVNLTSIPSKKPNSPKLPAAFSKLEEKGTLAPSYLLAPFESGTAIGAP